jgi:methionyl-tRNA formyltransferase
LGVVVAFGRLIRPRHLAQMSYVNIHFSLLPRWRGAAPVERAILAGDRETGCCLMALEEGLDTGPVYRLQRTQINDDETASQLRARLVDIGSRMLVEALSNPNVGLGTPVAQVGTPTHAAKFSPADFELHWDQPAEQLHRLIRLEQAWTMFRGKRLKVLEAVAAGPGGSIGTIQKTESGVAVSCGVGSLVLRRVQPEGKPAMLATDWANGVHPESHDRLGA